MSLVQLESFIAVAEEAHVGRAAQRLHVSQPPLTRRIKSLEEELGVELFERTPRGMRLRPAGSELLPRAREILARVQELRAIATRGGCDPRRSCPSMACVDPDA
jgi:DNA-binding transcriptional LysR family regulator